jgi:hypothetical protein
MVGSILETMPVFANSLPGLKFFEPLDGILDWIAESYREMEIYDIGAGMGHVAAGLASAGANVKAIDVILRDNAEFPIIHENALRYRFPSNSILMFCRPCHGFFVTETINWGLKCGVRDFIYIGLSRNVNDDLGRFRRQFKLAARKVGRDNESMYCMGSN